VVRTTLGAEVDTTVTVSGSESVDYLTVDQTNDLGSGNTRLTTIRPPAGNVYELLGIRLTCNVPGTASSGSHGFDVESETAAVRLLDLKSDHTKQVEYSRGEVTAANKTALPKSAVAQVQVLKGLRFDENNGLDISYTNNLDITQTRDRFIRVWVRQIEVS
jgi:hypothetical protein